METATKDLESLAYRIQRLERQNRIIKLGTLAVLLLLATVVVMGQAGQASTRTIEAQSFVLKDSNGNKRAELALFGTKGSILRFFEGDEVAASLTVAGAGSSRLDLIGADPAKSSGLTIGLRREGPWLGLWDRTGSALVDPTTLGLADSERKAVTNLKVGSGGSTLKLLDARGFATVIGNIDLVTPTTGGSHQTSAASIRMFNEKNEVFWAAPPQ